MAEPDAPSPYARASAMLEEGKSLGEIRQALLDGGLPSEDARAIVGALARRVHERVTPAPVERELPPESSRPATRASPDRPKRPDVWSVFFANALIAVALIAFGVGTIMVMAPTGRFFVFSGWAAFGGVVWLFAALGKALEGPPPEPPEVLPVDAPGARCGVHPAHASVGTCPRCGRFACSLCAPRKGFSASRLCLGCETAPSVLAARVRSAARALSATLVLTAAGMGVGLLMAPPLPADAPFDLPRASPVLAVALFAVLALVQWLTPHPAPGILGAGLAALAVFLGLLLFDEAMTGVSLGLAASMPVSLAFMSWRLVEQRKIAPGDAAAVVAKT